MVFEKKPFEPRRSTSRTPEAEQEIDPMETPIEELLKERADERRRKLKDFNYKFQNSVSNIDEIEKEPAYKRQGVDLNENLRENKNFKNQFKRR